MNDGSRGTGQGSADFATTTDAGEPLDVFETLRAFRQAARQIVRDESLGNRRRLALVRLLEVSRRDHAGDSWLFDAVRRTVWSEVSEYALTGRTPKAPAATWAADPVTLRLQTLRRSGVHSCTECRRPIPSLDALAGDEDRDRAVWLELVRREEALAS